MNIHYVKDYESLSKQAAGIVEQEASKKSNLLFCAATGNSPTGMYAEMAKKPSVFGSLTIVKMDEWGIIPLDHPDSCESYIKKHILDPLHIAKDMYVSFDTKPELVEQECERMEAYIQENGPFDVIILGLGKNGHIAFNEPGEYLETGFHKNLLEPSTIQHDPNLSKGTEPAYGLCVGMQGIMQARKIIFLVTGKGKQDAIQEILERRISTYCPATFLWMHPNVECLIDMSSLST
ncbi:6-phosphogluconolactonase [Cecembia lonarensis]|uniref:Glucosamine-6-phosphate deaminase 1 n=1 Tax=Cecembia lonarensis (strain CCUG 58316 / KCTC 22772 / LW9) TaxID=1225176 RepID=K1L138_CECL9|nr:6-phosphogluconolactonase [Cecembia lonarensis]EKB50120.1 Glucosamine-6-phosphate deaminase 1 [Cecembia lonarensis LW9]